MSKQDRLDRQLDDRKIEAAQSLVRTSSRFLTESKRDAFSPETIEAWNEYQRAQKHYNRLARR